MLSTRVLTLAVIASVIAGCGATLSPSSGPIAAPQTPSPPAKVVTPSPSTSGRDTQSAAPQAAPSDSEIAYLLSGFRHDIAPSGCLTAPKRLPSGAVAGIECRLSSSPAAQVGAYLFRDADSLDAAYLSKLAEYGAVKSGVQPSTDRGCAEGVASDRRYLLSATGGLPGRVGCFVNGAGYANIRVIWPESLVYVGVLGNDGDIAHLYEWTWQGSSPSDPGLAAWQPPDADPLADLYTAFRPEALRTQNGRLAFAAGEVIAFDYQLVNGGPTELAVPLIDFYGDLFYLAGSEQTWIQRLGNDSSIPCLASHVVDQEGRYADSGQILAFPGPPGPRVAPGDSLLRDVVLSDTSCFATSRYRFSVEYRRLAQDGAIQPGVFGGPVLGSVSFDFEIGDASH